MKTSVLGSLLVAGMLFVGCSSQPPLPDMQERLDSLMQSYNAKIIDKDTFSKLQKQIVDGKDRDKIYVGDRLISLKKAFDDNAVGVESYQKALNEIVNGSRKGQPLIGDELIKLKETYAKGLISMDEYANLKSKILD